jgi:hypothetical protein
MNAFGFIQATIPHTLKDPHSKTLEPDCLSPSVCNYDTASRWGRARVGVDKVVLVLIWPPLPFIPSHEGRGVSYSILSKMLEIYSQTLSCKNLMNMGFGHLSLGNLDLFGIWPACA